MIVVHASVVTNLLVDAGERGRRARTALGGDRRWIAPEHCKAEVFSAVRGLALAGKITPDAGASAIASLPMLGIRSLSLDPLLPRMWWLRAAVSGYDSAYVALAQIHSLTLVTADARLARAASAHCRVELAG